MLTILSGMPVSRFSILTKFWLKSRDRNAPRCTYFGSTSGLAAEAGSAVEFW
jgi:hypothetical protein